MSLYRVKSPYVRRELERLALLAREAEKTPVPAVKAAPTIRVRREKFINAIDACSFLVLGRAARRREAAAERRLRELAKRRQLQIEIERLGAPI